MISKMDTNGDTASLKRKREPKDDSPLSQKKHRRRSRSKPQDNAISETAGDAVEHAPSASALNNAGKDLELLDASLQAAGSGQEGVASWKISNPLGGRMLDIDPVFSLDER